MRVLLCALDLDVASLRDVALGGSEAIQRHILNRQEEGDVPGEREPARGRREGSGAREWKPLLDGLRVGRRQRVTPRGLNEPGASYASRFL
jgi:hypothetical protein